MLASNLIQACLGKSRCGLVQKIASHPGLTRTPICVNLSTHVDASMHKKAVQALSKQNDFLNGESLFHERSSDSSSKTGTSSSSSWSEAEKTSHNNYKESTATFRDDDTTIASHRLAQLAPDLYEFAPKISVVGVGGAGSNAINNMIAKGLQGRNAILIVVDPVLPCSAAASICTNSLYALLLDGLHRS